MRRIPFVTSAVVLASALSIATAFATPPTGAPVKYTDYARAQLIESANVPIVGGTTLVRGSYSVAPGGVSGWRSLPGTTVLAVTKGKLMLHGGEGCAAKDYAAGQAAVIPAGVYQVHNAGSEPLEFFGAFFGQPKGMTKPLAEGPTEEAPAGCTEVKAAGASPSGVSVPTSAAGLFVGSYYSQGATLEIKAGQDIFATQYDAPPGWSSGWFAHYPAVNVMEAGDLTYVEAKNGKCDESEVYHAGDSFYHPRHRHLATTGKDRMVITTIYFGLPHGESLPGPGNQLTAADFSQAPPADCPRLR
ncbi:MAG TPA: cupin domain-containing protein [Acidimicrobiia bacterium]|jgi:quercetin dioxygenase-like cupin family protein|nr:cupin domain-containing protein [Acidimicrobiia bacterium]